MNFPILTALEARLLITSGAAGYWELSLRDSLGKKPIAHSKQTCIFLEGKWHLVPVSAFEIKSHGRMGDEAFSAAVHTIEVKDDVLGAVVQAEAGRIGKRL